MKSIAASLGHLALLLIVAPSASAQFSLEWATVGAGGGTSAGGRFSLSGTVGQPGAGTMAGGTFTLEGGFWGLLAAVATDTEAPTLTIVRAGPATATISWPRPADDWVLEFTDEVPAPAGRWVSVAPPYQTNASTLSVSVTLFEPNGNYFFRLAKP